MQPQAEQMIKCFDTDGDKKLSTEEVNEMLYHQIFGGACPTEKGEYKSEILKQADLDNLKLWLGNGQNIQLSTLYQSKDGVCDGDKWK